ncbi:Uma2 family endonuclease [Kineococcus sp. R86509]|uniref:Uma2 family endonuclease n=1 Tax=Kineococcus sp. R86509 TaxID=3093851 RepID=UPI0036D2E0D7
MTEQVAEQVAELRFSVGQVLTWEEYAALPEDPRTEYVDGHLVVSPSPTGQHQKISFRLQAALEAVLPPTHDVLAAWGWKPTADEFIPDVIVFDRETKELGSDARFTGIPALVIEVLSSNRSDDLLKKMAEYATAGLPRYWILDPLVETLTTYASLDGVFAPTAVHGRAETPELDLGIATVRLNVAELLS